MACDVGWSIIERRMRQLSKWGVIPYRFNKKGGLEVLLITTKSKKWGLPQRKHDAKARSFSYGFG